MLSHVTFSPCPYLAILTPCARRGARRTLYGLEYDAPITATSSASRYPGNHRQAAAPGPGLLVCGGSAPAASLSRRAGSRPAPGQASPTHDRPGSRDPLLVRAAARPWPWSQVETTFACNPSAHRAGSAGNHHSIPLSRQPGSRPPSPTSRLTQPLLDELRDRHFRGGNLQRVLLDRGGREHHLGHPPPPSLASPACLSFATILVFSPSSWEPCFSASTGCHRERGTQHRLSRAAPASAAGHAGPWHPLPAGRLRTRVPWRAAHLGPVRRWPRAG